MSGSQSTGKKRYDKVIVVQIEEQINRWQYATKAVLARCFSAGSDHYREFEHTIVEHRDFNLDAKQDLASEVNNGRNILSAIIEAESLIGEIETTTSSNSKKQKKPLVFISLPVIVVYPELTRTEIAVDRNIQKAAERLWDNLPIFRNNFRDVPTCHVPLNKDLIAQALNDKDFTIQHKTHNYLWSY